MFKLFVRREKVRYGCPVCGSVRHNRDAVHCKLRYRVKHKNGRSRYLTVDIKNS